MPSPFPGMDPYIERPAIWSNMHMSLIGEIRRVLNEILPPTYIADIGERVYIQDTRDVIIPDVFISTPENLTRFRPSGFGAAAAVCDEPLVLEAHVDPATEPFIRIVHSKDESRVITEIEILSPANKLSAGNGRDEYKEKQKRLIASDVHFIEIDLLRAGNYTVACPQPTFSEAPNWAYIVSLHESGSRYRFEAWPRSMRQPLPRIRIPLDRERGDADISLDLQSVFSRCYDEGRFYMKAKYDAPPQPPLPAEDSAWATELLKKART